MRLSGTLPWRKTDLIGESIKQIHVLKLGASSRPRALGTAAEEEMSDPRAAPMEQPVIRSTYHKLLSVPGRRYYDAHMKNQGAILHEILPLCQNVTLQRVATFVSHLRQGARQRRAMQVLPKKLLRGRET